MMEMCFVHKQDFSSVMPWNADTVYESGALCAHGGDVFKSNNDDNEGNSPSDSPNWWTMQRDFEVTYITYWNKDERTLEQWMRDIGARIYLDHLGVDEIGEGAEDAFVEQLTADLLKMRGITEFAKVPRADLPTNWIERSAWKFDGVKVTHDDARHERIKAIHKRHKEKRHP